MLVAGYALGVSRLELRLDLPHSGNCLIASHIVVCTSERLSKLTCLMRSSLARILYLLLYLCLFLFSLLVLCFLPTLAPLFWSTWIPRSDHPTFRSRTKLLSHLCTCICACELLAPSSCFCPSYSPAHLGQRPYNFDFLSSLCSCAIAQLSVTYNMAAMA